MSVDRDTESVDTWAPKVIKSKSGEQVVFLGQEIRMSISGGVEVTQTMFAKDLLEKWQMATANPVQTPADSDDWKTGSPEEATTPASEEVVKGTQQIIGSLLWLAGRTRPDLVYCSSKLATILAKDPHRAFRGAKKALRYLRGTTQAGLLFTPEAQSDRLRAVPSTSNDHSTDKVVEVTGYGDASLGTEDLKSHHGAVVFWGQTGSPVAWRSGRQTLASTSTAESELQAVALASLMSDVAQSLIEELMGTAPSAMIMTDNTVALCIASQPPQHWRTRHLALRARVIQDRIALSKQKLVYVSSDKQRADVLTKSLSGTMMKTARAMIGVYDNFDTCVSSKNVSFQVNKFELQDTVHDVSEVAQSLQE